MTLVHKLIQYSLRMELTIIAKGNGAPEVRVGVAGKVSRGALPQEGKIDTTV